MGEELFHTLLRNICHSIVLTLMCLTYISSFPKSSFRNIILSVSLIFLAISYILNSRVTRIKDKVDPSLQKIPKLIFVIPLFIGFILINFPFHSGINFISLSIDNFMVS